MNIVNNEKSVPFALTGTSIECDEPTFGGCQMEFIGEIGNQVCDHKSCPIQVQGDNRVLEKISPNNKRSTVLDTIMKFDKPYHRMGPSDDKLSKGNSLEGLQTKDEKEAMQHIKTKFQNPSLPIPTHKKSKVFGIIKTFDDNCKPDIFEKEIKCRNSVVEAVVSHRRRSLGCIIVEDGPDQDTETGTIIAEDIPEQEPTGPEPYPEKQPQLISVHESPYEFVHKPMDVPPHMSTNQVFQQSRPSISSIVIPQPGESLNVNPLGSLDVPFEKVYQLGTIINSGAFGIVHKARHVFMTQLVAVKVIDRVSKEDDQAVIKEALILKDIRDLPNITTLIDFYMDNNKMYMVQALAAGGDVFDRLVQKKAYTESDVRNLAKSLLTTVASLHHRNLIHRDLKPENLLLRDIHDDAAILLCDFGYAKYLPSENDDDGKGRGLWTHCGTPAFTAPEIVEGIEYWAEVDMWSVGCILFMLLAGRQPFQGENDFELYELIASGDYGFDEPIWEFVSEDAKTLISNLLMLDRKQRFTSEQALTSAWFSDCSATELQSTDLTASLDGIRYYCEYIRPEGLHFICEDNAIDGLEETRSIEGRLPNHQASKTQKSYCSSIRIPQPGESLEVDPFGSLNVPFHKVYTLGDLINSGAFGLVHKACHVFMTDPVAVKIIGRTSKAENEAAIKEALILKDLRDLPNVATLIDFYMDNDKMYLVQQLAAGGDVFDRLAQKKTYTERDARNLAKSLLSTVQSLHDRNLIHRDLKPENLLLKGNNDDSSILLCDFGYAKYLPSENDGDSKGRGLWTHCGTPAFTAPEIVEGVEYWAEVDMWSVGCILFMLLAGSQPFQGENDFELYNLIASGDYGFDEPIWDFISSEAKTLISNLLVLDRKQRFTAKLALESAWFSDCSTTKLQSTDLTASLDGIRYYCECIRPEGLHFICEMKTGPEESAKERLGESKLTAEPCVVSIPESDQESRTGLGPKSEVGSNTYADTVVPTAAATDKKNKKHGNKMNMKWHSKSEAGDVERPNVPYWRVLFSDVSIQNVSIK